MHLLVDLKWATKILVIFQCFKETSEHSLALVKNYGCMLKISLHSDLFSSMEGYYKVKGTPHRTLVLACWKFGIMIIFGLLKVDFDNICFHWKMQVILCGNYDLDFEVWFNRVDKLLNVEEINVFYRELWLGIYMNYTWWF
jgi:hypothetical protein